MCFRMFLSLINYSQKCYNFETAHKTCLILVWGAVPLFKVFIVATLKFSNARSFEKLRESSRRTITLNPRTLCMKYLVSNVINSHFLKVIYHLNSILNELFLSKMENTTLCVFYRQLKANVTRFDSISNSCNQEIADASPKIAKASKQQRLIILPARRM